MLRTRAVSQLEMFWLKADAPVNICEQTTICSSPLFRRFSETKTEADESTDDRVVTDATFHKEMFWLKAIAPKNICEQTPGLYSTPHALHHGKAR